MSLTKCTINTNVIEALPDAPTSSADELKRKFDQAPSEIKNFINDVMLKEIEQLVAKEKENLQTIITETKNNLLTNISEKILEDNKKKYYVGKIIIDTENINPATYLGFGTWEYWGQGRVPVGVDTAQDKFNEVEKTGGHSQQILRAAIGAVNGDTGAIGYFPTAKLPEECCKNYAYYIEGKESGTNVPYNNINHATAVCQDNGEQATTLQPYITCYMWKRVS